MKTTAAKLIRWAGLSAMMGGSLFAGIQAVHPPETLAAVTTDAWAFVHYAGVAMCLLNLVGITGIYVRQVEQAGKLGLAGFLLLFLFWPLTAAFQFVEALVTPRLASEAPRFVEGFLGIPSGLTSEVDLGLLPAVYALNGILYLAGGVLLGIATVRAGVLPRWAGGLLAAGTVAPLAFSLLPHEFLRVAALPVSMALVWLGYALWSERRELAAQALTERAASAASRTAVAATGGEA